MAVFQTLVAGRYRLQRPVGCGGMGRVWLARDETLHRDVAVKEFLPPEWMSGVERDQMRDRTLREARSAARLNHPNVVRIYDVVHAERRPWIVMEYVPSRSLHQVVRESGPLTPQAAARLGLCVLAALTAAHRAGVLHRDVKPHNVLIGDDGRVVLTDFGLATFDGDGAVTRDGLVVGSPQYVSPERAYDGTSTVESDLWSLGATLYAAVEGQSPFARPSPTATLVALATQPPDPTERAGPLVPVLVGLLRKDPAARITAAETAALLRRVAAGGSSRSGPAVGHVPRSSVGSAPPRSGRTAGTVGPASSPPDGAAPAPLPSGGAAAPAPPAGGATDPAPSPAADARPIHTGPAGIRPPGIRRAGIRLPEARPPETRPPETRPPETRPTDVGPPETRPPETRPRPPGVGPPDRVGGRGGGRWVAVAAVLAVVAAVAAGAVARLDGAGRPTDRPDAATATSPTATAASPTAAGGGAGAGGFSPRVCDQAPAGNLPRTPLAGAATVAPNGYAMFEGWSFHRDPAGFGVAVPDGWTYAVVGTTVCFRDPDGVRVLSVDPARTASADPVVACRKEADRLTTAGALPGYRELRIDPVPYFGKAADWEYRYIAADGTGLHATTRWFAAGSRAYAVGWVTRAFDWQVNRANLGMIMGSFQPLQT